jgi:protein dithiol oxidoreductase (disulfide-forming)
MKNCRGALFALLVLFVVEARAASWTEGRDYYVITPSQAGSVPTGKVEVLEVFSYGCPACKNFQPTLQLLKKSLPPNAQLAFLPAAFNAAEDWPMFQRAYLTAQALGIAERTHQQMYDAVWQTGELATIDPVTPQRLKSPQPSIEDAARLYARWTGIKAADFLATAHSFGVDMKIRAADAQILAMQVPSTPCIVVAGRYRVSSDVVSSPESLIELVRYLVARAATH